MGCRSKDDCWPLNVSLLNSNLFAVSLVNEWEKALSPTILVQPNQRLGCKYSMSFVTLSSGVLQYKIISQQLLLTSAG